MPIRLSPTSLCEPAPVRWSIAADPIDLALLDWADPTPDQRVLLLGPNSLELMCALIRRGALDATTLRLPDRPEAGSADLVIIAHIGATIDLARAIEHARRALVAFGSVVIGLPSDPAVASSAHALLRHWGFCRIRNRAGSRAHLRAEVPLVGGLSRA